jgi:hypothetical protein
MNILDAAHKLAHEADGGFESLALRMGIGKKVFYGKVDPRDKTHILGVLEAVRMQQLTGRRDIIQAEADALNGVFLPKPSMDDMPDDLSTLISETCAEFGDYLRETDKALHDKQVTPNEVKKLQKELLELICAATRLHQRMASMADRHA